MKLGYGLDEATELGPMVSDRGRQKVIEFIEKGNSEGATIVLDGRKVNVDGGEKGFFLAPTILDDVTSGYAYCPGGSLWAGGQFDANARSRRGA